MDLNNSDIAEVSQLHTPLVIQTAVGANVALMMHGPPGCGKSTILADTAKDMDMDVIDIRLSQMDPVDLRGLPFIDKEAMITQWANAGFLPVDPDTRAILFFDEINQGNNAQQAAAFQLILDRKCGCSYTLPKGVVPMAAGNRAKDFAIVNKMSAALRNRFIHITVVSDERNWSSWASRNNIHESIIGFLHFRPEMLNEFVTCKDADRKRALSDAPAIATERSWHFLSSLLHHGIPEAVQLPMIEGTVGPAASFEFVAYLEHYQKLPDLDDLIENPDLMQIHSSDPPALKYALATGLAARATDDNAGKVFTILRKLEPEFTAMAVKDALQRTKAITFVPEFGEWAFENNQLLTGGRT